MHDLLRSRLRRRSSTSSTRHHVLYLIDRLASNGGTEGVFKKYVALCPLIDSGSLLPRSWRAMTSGGIFLALSRCIR